MVCSRRSSAAVDLGILRDVATMALDRPLRGLDPEQHVRARGIGPFAGQRAGQVGGLAGVERQIVQPIRMPQQGRGKIVQGAGQFARRDELGAPVVGQRLQRLAGERQAVARAGGDAALHRRDCRATPRRCWRARSGGPARLPLSTEEM